MHCIECFGPDRAMFASDFPVAGLHATFDEVYDSFRTIAAPLSESEQRPCSSRRRGASIVVDVPSSA